MYKICFFIVFTISSVLYAEVDRNEKLILTIEKYFNNLYSFFITKEIPDVVEPIELSRYEPKQTHFFTTNQHSVNYYEKVGVENSNLKIELLELVFNEKNLYTEDIVVCTTDILMSYMQKYPHHSKPLDVGGVKSFILTVSIEKKFEVVEAYKMSGLTPPLDFKPSYNRLESLNECCPDLDNNNKKPNNYTPIEIDPDMLLPLNFDNQINTIEFDKKYYNRNKAQNYALKYVRKANAQYIEYDNDCTNFISQCLKAGGWIETLKGDRTNPRYWFYRRVNACYSWTKAQKWTEHSPISSRARNVTKVSLLNIGDIISIDYNKDNHIDHSMIITTYENHRDKYLIKVSYHSRHTRDKNLSDILKKYPTTAFYTWSITGTRTAL